MKYPLALLSILLFQVMNAQVTPAHKKISGPVITGYGDTFAVAKTDFPTDTTRIFKPVFDIAQGPENPEDVNVYFNTVARFLNMHVNAGVPLKNLKPVMVVHGSAAYGLLKAEAYQEKFGTTNPNLPLLDQLDKAGVQVILCGQTAASRAIDKNKRWEHTKLALSAMTALIQLEDEGYRSISF